jgi:RNA polymerase sigma-70 factor (ECF subfamily)
VEGALVPVSSHPAVPDEFSAWVEPHLTAMTRLATVLTSLADGEDVVQEALVRAWKRRSTFDASRGTTEAWLLAIVRDQARRRRTRQRDPSAGLIADAPTHDTRRDLDLERAVAALPPRQREVIELHYFVGLDIKTCATLMGCAEGTVKATLHQARARLHRELSEKEVHDG